MSKPLKKFEEAFFKRGLYKKLFQKQTPGKRIAPPQSGTNDADLQFRLDAGEIINGKKNVYLQINSQAKNEILVKFRKKKGSDANVACGEIDENTPPGSQEEAAREFWEGLARQAKDVFR